MSKTKSNPTQNSVPSGSKEKLVALLNQELADLGDLYSQTKQAHWNVRGKKFYQLHLLFDQVADSANENWDDVAERAVHMAAKASQLPEWPEELEAEEEFVMAVVQRFAHVANSMRAGIATAADL